VRASVLTVLLGTGCAGGSTDGRVELPHEPGGSGERASEIDRCHPHGCGDSPASSSLDFVDGAHSEDFWCDAPGTPEMMAGGGQCHTTKQACIELAEHRQSQYGQPGMGGCLEQDEAWCFQQLSWGRRMDVCRSSEASCEAHRKRQVRDDRVSAITPRCERR